MIDEKVTADQDILSRVLSFRLDVHRYYFG